MDKPKMKNLCERLPDEERLKPLRDQIKTVDSLMTAVEQTWIRNQDRFINQGAITLSQTSDSPTPVPRHHPDT